MDWSQVSADIQGILKCLESNGRQSVDPESVVRLLSSPDEGRDAAFNIPEIRRQESQMQRDGVVSFATADNLFAGSFAGASAESGGYAESLAGAEAFDGSPLLTPERSEGAQDLSDMALFGMLGLSALDGNQQRRLLASPGNETVALNCARLIFHERGKDEGGEYARKIADQFPKITNELEHLKASFEGGESTLEDARGEVESMTLIVHGTWARDSDWWKPNIGNFWKYINGITKDAYSGDDAFFWNASNHHHWRIEGARKLKKWVEDHPSKRLRVIAHSHGANVCYIASRLGVEFDQIISLGGPICLEYIPDFSKIKKLDNVFSTRDGWQMAGSAQMSRRGEGRTIPEQSHVRNTWVSDLPLGDVHSNLHEKFVWEKNDLSKIL